MEILTTIKMGNLVERINLNDCKNCFAVPGSSSMIDVIHPITGKTVHYGKTLDECRAEPGYEKAELMTVEAFCKDKAAKQDEPVTWKETTRERYWEMLEVLPPAYMCGGYFLVGEPWDHHAVNGRPRYAAFGEIGESGRFVEASRPMTVAELKALVT